MLAKTAAIALGVIVTVVAGMLLGTFIPSGISYPSAELANSPLKQFVFYHLWHWLPALTYTVAAILGGAAATLAYAGHTVGIAAGIGAVFPLLMALGTMGSHLPFAFESALVNSILGTAGAFVGQLLVQRIRLSLLSRPQKEAPPEKFPGKSSRRRAAIAFPVAFFVTVCIFRLLLALVKYEPYSSPLVLACLAIFSATVLGTLASSAISKPRSDIFPLCAGLVVPVLLYLFGIASIFGIDFPYDTRLPALVSLAVYWGFPVFTLKHMAPIQHSLLAICGIAGAYCGRSLPSRQLGLLRNIVWVMPCMNCLGTFALIAGIAMVFLGQGTGDAIPGTGDAILIVGGFLAGFLGSIPTLVLARIVEDKTVFKLATLSLSVSFIAVALSLLVPILMPTRHRGNNDSGAVASVRTITTAEVTYLSISGGRYGTMEDLIAAGLLDTGFNVTKGGYIYAISTTGVDYTITARPASAETGRYAYYSVSDGVVRYSTQTTLAPAKMAGNPVY